MARTLTSGEKTAAAAIAPAKTVTAGTTSQVHVAVALETFSIPYNGHLVTFVQNTRVVCDSALKALVQSSDKTVTWES